MSRTLLAFAVAGFGSLFATGLCGQVVAPLAPGQTVRITDEAGHRHTGVIHSISSDSLTIEHGLWPEAYALADLSKIEEKTGSHMSVQTIPITMAATALAVGLIVAVGECEGSFCPTTPARGFAAGALVGAALGLPLGLILTPIIRYGRWEPVAMPSSQPAVGLGLTIKIPLPAW